MSKNNLLSRVKRLAISASLVLASVGMAQTEITVVGQSQESIQAALDALGGPGTVFVPAGRYQIDGTLIIRNYEVTLQGSGDDTVLFRSIDESITPMVQSLGHQQVRITGIRFEGFPTSIPSAASFPTAARWASVWGTPSTFE